MTLFRGTFIDTPQSPFKGHHLRAEQDAALLVTDGVIAARGPADRLLREHPDDDVVDLREGLVLPGFVDTHVHFPQVRAIGGLGMPLLDWLERCALPEEARLADTTYAAGVAADFVDGLARAGTTTALVFGSHFATAVDALFTEADRVGLRVTSGLVLSDRILREDLFTDPDRAYAEGLALADRWHGRSGAHALRRHAALLALLHRPAAGVGRGAAARRTRRALHLAPQRERRGDRAACASCSAATTPPATTSTGCSGRGRCSRTTCTRPRRELRMLGRRGAAVAHCPTSNAALGSGMFPLGAHLAFGVRVALGLRRRRGHRLLAVQGGPAGVLHPAAARPRGPPPHRWTPAAPGHRGRRRCARVGGHRGRLRGRQGLRRPLAEPRTRHHARRRPCGTPTPPTTRWPRRSRWPARPTYGRPGSPAHRFVCMAERRRSQQTADESGETAPAGVWWAAWRDPQTGGHVLPDDHDRHSRHLWFRPRGTRLDAGHRPGGAGLAGDLCAGRRLGLAADASARVVHRPDGRRRRPLVRRPADRGPDGRGELRHVPRRDDHRRVHLRRGRADRQRAEADLAADHLRRPGRGGHRRHLLLRHRAASRATARR